MEFTPNAVIKEGLELDNELAERIISFTVSNENEMPRVYREYGKALVLSITLVPGKIYISTVTQYRTKDVGSVFDKLVR